MLCDPYPVDISVGLIYSRIAIVLESLFRVRYIMFPCQQTPRGSQYFFLLSFLSFPPFLSSFLPLSLLLFAFFDSKDFMQFSIFCIKAKCNCQRDNLSKEEGGLYRPSTNLRDLSVFRFVFSYILMKFISWGLILSRHWVYNNKDIEGAFS